MKKLIITIYLILLTSVSFSQKARLVLHPNPKFKEDTVLVYLYYSSKYGIHCDTIFYSENLSKEYLIYRHIVRDFDIPTNKEISLNIFVVNQDLKAELLFHKLKRNTAIGITINEGACFGKPCNNYIQFYLNTIKLFNKAQKKYKKMISRRN